MKNQKKEMKTEALTSLPKKQSNNNKRTMMNSGKIVLGVLAGIGVGALIGIVLAPQKGSKMRRKMLKKGRNYLDEVKEQMEVLFNETADRVEEKWNEKGPPAIKESILDHERGLKNQSTEI